MTAVRQRRIWPYLLLLAGLFALSVTAPRAWRRAALRYRQPQLAELAPRPLVERAATELARPELSQREVAARAATAAIHDTSDSTTILSPAPRGGVMVSSSADRLAMLTEPATSPSFASPQPAATEESEERSGAAESTDDALPDLVQPTDSLPSEESAAIAPPTLTTAEPTPQTSIESGPARGDLAAPLAEALAVDPAPLEVTDQPSPDEPPPSAVAASDSVGWREPRTLLEQIAALEEISSLAAWIEETRTLLRELAVNPVPPADVRADLLARLRQAHRQLESLATEEPHWPNKVKMLRVQYSLARRLDIWDAIHALGAPPVTQVTVDDERNFRLARRIAEFSAVTGSSREGEAWRRHLKVDALQQAVRGDEEPTPGQRRRLAHLVLGRMAEARKNPQQASFVRSPAVSQLDAALRDWSAEAVDLSLLLENLERYEESPAPHIARLLAEQSEALKWSPDEEAQQLGKALERHYRNANLRLAISDDLLNRYLPKPQVFEAPVEDMIMGASVSGFSRTLNRLQLRLIPDPHKLRLGLEAHGTVHSDTGASSGPVTIYSQGETSYVARKLLLVGDTGLHVWPAVAEASAASNTQGMDTDYDSIPFVRTFVRKMAQTQHDDTYGDAMAQVEARVRDTARQRLDREADPRIKKLNQVYLQKVQSPLERLGLSPEPIGLSTTADRAIVRLRLAGEAQLGAHTPRPCAPSDSVASIQVHESVLNNMADQLALSGQTFTLPELHRVVSEKLGLQLAEPEDLPADAQVTFAEHDAVLIRCEDGKVQVTLSVAELTQGRRRFRNFQATAFYRIISRGLHTELERDGVVQLAGERLGLGDQIALRGVASKLFTQNRRPQVISTERASDARLTGLRVSQLVVADGWIGLAIAPERLVREPQHARTSATR